MESLWQLSNLEMKFGVATYRRWAKVSYHMPCTTTGEVCFSGKGFKQCANYPKLYSCFREDWVWLPNHHVPYLKVNRFWDSPAPPEATPASLGAADAPDAAPLLPPDQMIPPSPDTSRDVPDPSFSDATTEDPEAPAPGASDFDDAELGLQPAQAPQVFAIPPGPDGVAFATLGAPLSALAIEPTPATPAPMVQPADASRADVCTEHRRLSVAAGLAVAVAGIL